MSTLLDNSAVNVLTRDLINPNMRLIQHDINRENPVEFDYKKFCDMIDYWKILLIEKYDAQPGKTVLLEFNLTNAYYYSAIFACFELGLISIIDFPHAMNEDDVNSYRMTMHGKIDYAIIHSGQTDPDHHLYHYWDLRRTQANCQQIITDKDFDNYTIKDHGLYNSVSKKIFATPDSDAIWSCSSGTTGLPKKIVISHKKTLRQAQRLVKFLGFSDQDKTLHVRNLHHGASMCYHFLPSWMAANEHYILNVSQLDKLPDVVTQHKINKVLLYSNQMLNDFLKSTPPLTHCLDIITLFSATKHDVELMKQKNVNSIRIVFGDTTIGLGFFVKVVDQSVVIDTYQRNMVGVKLDDFFDFKIENNVLWIAIPELNESWKTSNDRFELNNGQYYFLGRNNRYRFGADWVMLRDIESKTESMFGENNATIVIDGEKNQIYLSIWNNTPGALEKLQEYFENTYETTRINKITTDLVYDEFMSSRKIDRQRLRDHFRRCQ
jgi:hypothetical protein